MKEAETLLQKLGVTAFTQRHVGIIEDFIASGETDAKKLLDKIGSWDQTDLAITEQFLKDIKSK
jgi:hypothetical protein